LHDNPQRNTRHHTMTRYSPVPTVIATHMRRHRKTEKN
jgi:hypothetical protein